MVYTLRFIENSSVAYIDLGQKTKTHLINGISMLQCVIPRRVTLRATLWSEALAFNAMFHFN